MITAERMIMVVVTHIFNKKPLLKNLKNRSISFNREEVDNIIGGYDHVKINVYKDKTVVYEIDVVGESFFEYLKDMGDYYVFRF